MQLLECLAVVTFIGGEDPEETEQSMQIMWQVVHPKSGANVRFYSLGGKTLLMFIGRFFVSPLEVKKLGDSYASMAFEIQMTGILSY